MTNESSSRITEALGHIARGDPRAAAELLPLLYDELRKLARARMARERPGQTLQSTALVHEAYLRLVGEADRGWENRAHFFAAAAEAMRRILVERARYRGRQRRGGGAERASLHESHMVDEQSHEELLAVDQLLARLEAQDAEMAQVVKLRYFAGFEVEETAATLGLSERTVYRHWKSAKAWLKRELALADGTDTSSDSD